MNTTAALWFLIGTLMDLYAYVVLARFLFQLVRADFYNPISQFVVRATNPLLVPLRKLIPGFKGIDFACLTLLLLVQIVKYSLGMLVVERAAPGVGVVLLGLIGSFALVIDFYIFTIFAQVILSWIAPGGYNPMIALLYQVTEPLLAPVRRFLPAMGGLDLSPMVVLLLLSFFKIMFNLGSF